MQLVPLNSKSEEKEFIQFPVSLYRDTQNWIRPMDADIRAVFDPEKNKAFSNGDCRRWILKEDARTIGRIAAFVLRTTHKESGDTISGGVGFFECIDDQKAADMLFDAARDWLNEQGATYMDGPINFGRRDKWWGLLTKGFDVEPNYQCNYNFPYYAGLFENYGFKTYYQQYTFIRNVFDPLSKRLEYKSELVASDSAYSFDHLRLSNFEKYASDIIEVYNKAWVKHEGVNELSMEQGKAIMGQLKPILDEKIIWIAYFEGRPVAIFVCIPEVNQLLKYVNGKLNLPGKLKFFWHKKTGRNKKLLGMVFGVVPEHQGKGVDGAIIKVMSNVLRTERKYEIIEMSGIGDFNPKMILVMRQVGGTICKIHNTYRYLFDRTLPFERMKSIR
ncbi:hypothetical protein [Robiginitalea aurantiaca]|uniref:N-acetyltransferase domain-containing protein n=1 Tax=Robiginitalea aurantiaca TaxID=3056915 RepID=A0ABT7WEH3_9FLAO|nr:hypothetical protein [Robiginitalea aurantiaca]MDM9631323.1 hypothetical protein [Robiginitalea aurantiaca]